MSSSIGGLAGGRKQSALQASPLQEKRDQRGDTKQSLAISLQQKTLLVQGAKASF